MRGLEYRIIKVLTESFNKKALKQTKIKSQYTQISKNIVKL